MKKVLFHIFLISISGILIACEKRDPKPELKDPIYQDLISQLSISEKALAEEQKQLADHQSKLDEVVPQTGQIKYARKRVFDSQARITRYEQQVKYWKIRITERMKYARKEYEKAFAAGKSWPDPREFQLYTSEKRLREAKIQWDIRKRMEDSGKVAEAPKESH